jgi:hypothetical protein
LKKFKKLEKAENVEKFGRSQERTATLLYFNLGRRQVCDHIGAFLR